jgi:transcriptional regulator with XRE-family HTH domain
MTQPTPWTYLRRQRDRAGYSLSRLAAESNIHVSHLCKVEAGTRGLSPELRNRVAKILNLDIDELIASAPKPPSQTTGGPTRDPQPSEVAS